MKTYSTIDIAKFMAAILVVAIHTVVLSHIEADASLSDKLVFFLGILGRNAIPFFFITSSFFLYRKTEGKVVKSTTMSYVSRIMKLYLFWFVLLLPYIIYTKFIINPNPFYVSFADFGRHLLFNSSFGGSWYLNACIWNALIILILSKWIKSNRLLLLIGLLLYVIACLDSSYSNLMKSDYYLQMGRLFFCSFRNSFWSGMIFFVIGKIMAEKQETIIAFYQKRKQILRTSLVFMLGINLLEAYFINIHGITQATDCFLSLIPTSILLFILLLNAQLRPQAIHIRLRNYSIIIYISQFTFIPLFSAYLLEYNSVLLYIKTLLAGIILSEILFILSSKYKIFKLSY